MDSWRFFMICVILWCSNDVAKVQSLEKALIFSQRDKQLFEKDPYDDLGKCFECITACPAETQKEATLDQYASISGYGVFLQNVYINSQGYDYTFTMNMNTVNCDYAFIPAIVWDRNAKSYEIGYELFYDEGQVDLPCYDYKNYVRIGDTGAPIPGERELPNNRAITSYDNNGSLKFEITDDDDSQKSVFYWIKVLSIIVLASGDSRAIDVKRDTINDYFHRHLTITECTNYYSAHGIMSTYINRPNTANQGLIKTPIVPMRTFHSLSARLATCTYLNIAFIWEAIANGHLKEVDLFLYAVYRTWPSQIFITYGVSGDLENDNMLFNNLFQSEDELFKRFPVPKVLFRVVEFQWNGVVFNVAIIIHNNVYNVPAEDRICPVPQPGWEEITNNANTTPGLTYACEMSTQIARKLGINRRLPQSYYFSLVGNLLDSVQQKLAFIRSQRIVD